MLQYILRRIFGIIPVGLGIVIIVSMLIHAVPGDPVDSILGPYATLEEKEELRHSLGLDTPLLTQTKNYIFNITQGSLGESLIYNKPVTQMIGERIRPTVELAIASLIVAIVISIPLGVISAIKANTIIDFGAMGFALAGVAIPNFWLGPMLVLLFSVYLGWLPVSERGSWQTYILPAITMGTALAAALSRMTRNSMLDEFNQDFVRTARSKGVLEYKIIMKHVFRNAALPLVTVVGLQFGVLLTGAIITEKIFDWPGLGSLILEGINNRDYPVVQGCVLFFSCSYLIVNLLTDIAYAFVDPRIKPE